MRKSIALLILGCLLAACGQKGPLYLPKTAGGVSTSMPAPTTAVRADDKKNADPANPKSP